MINKLCVCLVVAVIFLTGTMVLHGMVKAEREAKADQGYKFIRPDDPNIVYTWTLPKGDHNTIIQDSEGNRIFSNIPDIIITEPNLIFTADIMWDWKITSTPDICFGSDPSVMFMWENGMFDVVFDPNRLTESAKVFCAAIEPYINEHIIEKAKELAVTK